MTTATAGSVSWIHRLKQSGRIRGLKNLQLELQLDGLLTLSQTYPSCSDRELLARHGNWSGPVKLERVDGQVIQRVDVLAGQALSAHRLGLLGEEERDENEQFMVKLLEGMPDIFRGKPKIPGWNPPEAKMIGNWLTEAGHETAIDKKGHLRLTVKRRGCDGQIRIERQEGRLRLALTLGRWSKLEPSAEAAILRLAGEANTRSRLVRIAWLEKEGFHYCQAQVDLTGLPVGSELNSPLAGPRALMWKGMVQAAVDALKLALKRLGLELPALGDPKNKTLAEMVAMQLGAGPPADRKIQ